MEPSVSVVVATVGRAEKLARTLDALGRLHPDTPSFEVIVVLDGSDRPARSVAEATRAFPMTVVEQERKGPGPAKNLGARHAAAPYLLFLNDDTRPDPGCLVAHQRVGKRHGPCVVVGRIDWDPEREVTPYMAWLAPAGHLFNFSRLDPGRPVPWDACWGAHVGLPRAWHLEDPFDERFPYPSLEDVEWGFRLTRRGRPIRYAPDALALHDHFYASGRDYRMRARASGAATRHTTRHHPRLLWPLILRPAAAAAALTALALWPLRWRRTTRWELDFRWNYLLGVLSRQERARFRQRADDP